MPTIPTTRFHVLCLALLFACNGRSADAPAAEGPPSAAPQAAQREQQQPSVSSGAQRPGAAPVAADTPSAGGLRWRDVAPFERRAPKSSMRAAEYGVAGDPRAELAVFYFGADQGGTVAANESRWIGQITQPDGSDSAGKAKRDQRTVNGVEISLLEVSGNYSGGMAMPGGPAPEPMPDATMLAAIAKGPEGPVFFKYVAPSATVERTREAFEQMIGSLEPAK